MPNLGAATLALGCMGRNPAYDPYGPMATTGWLSLMDLPGRVLSCGAAGSRRTARLAGAVKPRCRGRAGLACPPAGRPEASPERPSSFKIVGATRAVSTCVLDWPAGTVPG